MPYFNYDLYFWIILGSSLVALVFLATFSIYYLFFWSISGKKVPEVPHNDAYTKFAILIAARNESKVIRNILNSLKDQTYPSEYFDVWLIVEDIADPTVEIAKEFGYHYFVRDRLTSDRRTKGFALQECIDYFKRENIKYDSYMIFDADNVVDKRFVEVMNDLRGQNVMVGVGNRCFTNADENIWTADSAIMFTYMNQVTSRGRTALFHKATLMGTGYYVDASIIEEAGGWIFTGMTEDIQLTTYCYYHDINMRFYPLVNFYDEQSPKYKVNHTQHLRWIYGYFERRKYIKKAGISRDYHTKSMQRFMKFEFNCGLIPFAVFCVYSFIIGILCLVFGAFAVTYKHYNEATGIFILAGWQFFIVWLVFVIPAILVIYRHNDTMKLSKKNIFLAVITYFFYFSDFVLAIIDGFFHPSKRTNWKPIEHTGDIIDKSAKEVSK